MKPASAANSKISPGPAGKLSPALRGRCKSGDLALIFALVMMLLALVLPFAYARRQPTLELSIVQVLVWLVFCAAWIYLGTLLDREGNDILTTQEPEREPRRFGSAKQIIVFLCGFAPLTFAYIYYSYLNTSYVGFNFVLLFVVAGFSTHFFPFWLVVIYLLAQALAWGALCVAMWGSWPRTDDLITTASGYIFAAMMFFFLRRERASRFRAEKLSQELDAAYEKLRAFSGQIEELASTQERNRIAREIHDTLGHSLTVVNMQLETARALLATDASRADEFICKAQAVTRRGLDEVRSSVAALRVSPLEGVPLRVALQKLLSNSLPADSRTSLEVVGEPRELPSPVASALFRSAQEALTNVRKHARAKSVEVELRFEPSRRVRLVIKDDGVGCERAEGGFGILGIRERTQLLGGETRLATRPGDGFELTISLPA